METCSNSIGVTDISWWLREASMVKTERRRLSLESKEKLIKFILSGLDSVATNDDKTENSATYFPYKERKPLGCFIQDWNISWFSIHHSAPRCGFESCEVFSLSAIVDRVLMQ